MNYPRNTYNGKATQDVLNEGYTTLPQANTMFANNEKECDDECIKNVRTMGLLMGGLQSDKQDESECKTEAELEQIKNKNARENDKQNCAKINNIFIPYFDAGPIRMRTAGRFKYFSSRNNNFSNRDQTGILCVGTTCDMKQSDEAASLNGIVSAAKEQ